ncbi:tripartite tricarboxylate transporter permease [Candidatus Woesearchaeota archaeon]|nr:tripartite tricarboxylate transporter permease [Candidatus Woesearchaeota archaeon]
MFFEILIAITLGIIAGVLTGITPGVHVNLVSVILLSASPFLLQYTSVLSLAVFIVSMAITHSYMDMIPSTFLGVPDPDTVMGVLPGHQLLMEGKGYEAVKLTVIGSYFSLLIGICIVPLLIIIIPLVYDFIAAAIGWFILLVVLFMIFKEKTIQKKLWAFLIFSFSGLLGIIVLDFPNLSQPLLPLLSGLFGVSGLLISLANNTVPPPQKISETIFVEPVITGQALFAAVTSGWLTSMLPGLGSAQGAIISSTIFRNLGNYGYMILVGGIDTVNFLLSLVTLYTIERARNGAVIVIQSLIEHITLSQITMIMCAALIVGSISVFLCLGTTRIFARIIEWIPYSFLCWSVISIVMSLVAYFSGLSGLVVLFVSTALGMIPVIVGVGRNHSMGCLLVPVMIFFLY